MMNRAPLSHRRIFFVPFTKDKKETCPTSGTTIPDDVQPRKAHKHTESAACKVTTCGVVTSRKPSMPSDTPGDLHDLTKSSLRGVISTSERKIALPVLSERKYYHRVASSEVMLSQKKPNLAVMHSASVLSPIGILKGSSQAPFENRASATVKEPGFSPGRLSSTASEVVQGPSGKESFVTVYQEGASIKVAEYSTEGTLSTSSKTSSGDVLTIVPVVRGRPFGEENRRDPTGAPSQPNEASQPRFKAEKTVTFARPVLRRILSIVPTENRVLEGDGTNVDMSASEDHLAVVGINGTPDRVVNGVVGLGKEVIKRGVGEEAKQQSAVAVKSSVDNEPRIVINAGGEAGGAVTISDSDIRYEASFAIDEGDGDTVTLLVDKLGVGGVVYDLMDTDEEVLQLVEKTADGERPMEMVSEVSLVGIRAVCGKCGCAISHHIVGLLARRDGSEYGYRCRICQTVLIDAREMAAHMDSHRPDAKMQCRFCSRGLQAFLPESNEEVYRCLACSAVFETRSSMMRHRQTHPANELFPCELCDKSFPMKLQLEVHMRSHLGLKPYSCDLCPSSFVQPSHLVNHRRTHTGERPFRCERCSRAFIQQAHLNAHMLTHTGERPFECDKCGRRFRQSGQLVTHKKQHEKRGDDYVARRHRDAPPSKEELTCPECYKEFSAIRVLRRHMLIHGESEKVCDICQRAFNRTDHLKRHMALHNRASTDDRDRQHWKPKRDGVDAVRFTRLPRTTPAMRTNPTQFRRGLELLDGTIDNVLDTSMEELGEDSDEEDMFPGIERTKRGPRGKSPSRDPAVEQIWQCEDISDGDSNDAGIQDLGITMQEFDEVSEQDCTVDIVSNDDNSRLKRTRGYSKQTAPPAPRWKM